MKNYYRVMLGRKSINAEECFAGNFIGVHFGFEIDFTGKLPENWREFNRDFIPLFLENHPGKSKVAAGLACGAVWTVTKGIQRGDIVLCPDGRGRYRLGEVVGEYAYAPGTSMMHRRPVRWMDVYIDRADMTDVLRNSAGSIGTVSDISKHREEIESFIRNQVPATGGTVSEDTMECIAQFAMEKHLEDFLVKNWAGTELGREYDIYEEDGDMVGQQYPTDTGPMDVLAISKDRSRLLVVELKRGRTSDVVVGQVLRYMGFVKEELAEDYQEVRGVIIALEDDQRIRRALSIVPAIEFFRYEIDFRLVKH